MSSLTKTEINEYVETSESVQNEGIIDVIVGIVPSNIIQPMAEGAW